MADVIKVDDLAGEIVLAVRTYTEEVGEAIEEAVKETAQALAADLRETSPKDTGEYAKGWTARKEGPGRYVVYNKKKPQLTHLLEHGHAKAGGGRVEGRPHIKPAEERHVPQLERKIAQILERGG
jgi:hypothetical protein